MIIVLDKTISDTEYISVTMEFKSLGNQLPYFSIITQDGCDHDAIREHFPELAKYIKWHLVSSKEPMHYIANSMYWLKEDNMDNFKSTALIGCLPNDTTITEFIQMDKSVWYPNLIENLLWKRLPYLMELFHRDMRELFGDDYETKST